MSHEPLGPPEMSEAIELMPSRRKIPLGRGPRGESRRARLREGARPYAGVARIALAQLTKSRLARAGALAVACFAMIAVFADLLASRLPLACRLHGSVYVLPAVTRPAALADYDCARVADEADWAIYPVVRFGPSQTTTRGHIAPLLPPLRSGHPLGTDAAGRDVFARVVHGARTALTLGLFAVVTFVGIGIFLGALAGFFGGAIDALVARLVETLTAFPTLVFVLVVQAVLPHPTAYTLLLAIGLTRWTEVARLVRAEVLLASAQDYATAARALGASPWRILRRHVLPNAVAPALVTAAFGIASVVLIESSLDFLRVGLPASVASWGEVMSEARTHAWAWWLFVFPGVSLFVMVVGLNLVGEAMRDALDPRLRDANVTVGA